MSLAPAQLTTIGFVADRLGDPSREHGRFTLNPIPHIDLFFMILPPLFLILSSSSFIFGGAKPVPVDVSRLRTLDATGRSWGLPGRGRVGGNIPDP